MKTSGLNIFDLLLKYLSSRTSVAFSRNGALLLFLTVYIPLWLPLPYGITQIYYTAESHLGISSCLIPRRICQRSVGIFLNTFPSSDMAESPSAREEGMGPYIACTSASHGAGAIDQRSA